MMQSGKFTLTMDTMVNGYSQALNEIPIKEHGYNACVLLCESLCYFSPIDVLDHLLLL